MAFTNLRYHVIYSTKERRPLIVPEMRDRLYQFTGGIIRNMGGSLLEMNATDNHVHFLAFLTHKKALCDQIRDIKSGTSKWVHQTFPQIGAFAWQESYGMFCVCESVAPSVQKYIQNQQEHHREMTFEQEFIAFLKKHGIDYDPKYVFD